MIKYNINLTEQQIEKLKGLSRDTGLAVSEHVRRAIDEYLVKIAREGRTANGDRR